MIKVTTLTLTAIVMTILVINVDTKKIIKIKTNLRNPKYKSNLNDDNDNSVDDSKHNNNNNNNDNNNNNKYVFILGDSIVKNLNGFLKTKAINNKCILKVRPFSSAKVRCMYDHLKPKIRYVNTDNIILHVGTNELNSEKTSSQIARSINGVVISLKTITIMIYVITPRNDHLNNKASEVNDRLVNICVERHIPVTGHSETIHPDALLNKSGLHLNKSGAMARDISRHLLKV